MYAINPAMVILLVPIISAYSRGVHPFKLIVRGSFITAASPFVLVFGASYFTAIMFVVLLSAGEVIYSPPVYAYTMMLAPKGREGIYTSLASAPMFVAKLFVGGLSGILLQEYCPQVRQPCVAPACGNPSLTRLPPQEPPRDCDTMWLIIGLISAASPVLMCALQRVIQPEGTATPMRSDEGANCPFPPPTACISPPLRPVAAVADDGIVMTDVGGKESKDGSSEDETPEKATATRKLGAGSVALLAEGDREMDVGSSGFGTIALDDTPRTARDSPVEEESSRVRV